MQHVLKAFRSYASLVGQLPAGADVHRRVVDGDTTYHYVAVADQADANSLLSARFRSVEVMEAPARPLLDILPLIIRGPR